MTLVKLFPGPLHWESSLSILLILGFGLFIVSWIFWMFHVRILLNFVFSLTVMSISSIVSSYTRDSLLYYLFLYSVTPDLFSRFSMSKVASLCDLCIVSISIFRFWTVLFHSFTCLIVFSCISLRGLCFYLFTCVLLYLCPPYHPLSTSWDGIFGQTIAFQGLLGYPGLAVVGELSYDGINWHWFLLLMFLWLPLTIWLSQVLTALDVSEWILSIL